MSSILHDCLAVYLTTSEDGVGIEVWTCSSASDDMKEKRIVVNDAGRTEVSDLGKKVRVALKFTNLEGVLDNLVETLTRVK